MKISCIVFKTHFGNEALKNTAESDEKKKHTEK